MKPIHMQEPSTDTIQNALTFLAHLPDLLGSHYVAPTQVQAREFNHIHVRWGDQYRYLIVCFIKNESPAHYRYENGGGYWLLRETTSFEDSWKWLTEPERKQA